jgi:diguanylate cyclase (GGDEF)-like protein
VDLLPSTAGVVRRLVPSTATTVLAFALVGLDKSAAPAELMVAAALAVVVLVVACVTPWGSVPHGLRLLPCLLFFVTVFLLRDSLGGSNLAGIGLLGLLPIAWLALHGTRTELIAGLVAFGAFAMLPVLVIGGDDYPIVQLRGAAMCLAVAAVIGLTVQSLVAALAAHAENIARVATAARAILVAPDARREICAAVCDVAGASYAILVEPTADGRLRSTAMTGIAADSVTVERGSATSATHRAFEAKRAVLVKNAANDLGLNRRLWEAHGRPGSMLFEPVLQGDAAVGVLIVGWAQRVPDARNGGPALVALLAAEAATAITHADLVEQLGRQARTDSLTGLPNRRAWKRELDRAVHAEAGRDFCVAMLDLDLFKAYNDQHGHLAGDRQLKHCAAAWQGQLRPGDILARLGGEEFGVILSDCSLSDAMAVIERLRAATPGGQTCSAGLVARRDSELAVDLIARADAAMYESKHAGRDRLTTAIA